MGGLLEHFYKGSGWDFDLGFNFGIVRPPGVSGLAIWRQTLWETSAIVSRQASDVKRQRACDSWVEVDLDEWGLRLRASSFKLRASSRVESSRVKFVDRGGLIRIKLGPGLRMLWGPSSRTWFDIGIKWYHVDYRDDYRGCWCPLFGRDIIVIIYFAGIVSTSWLWLGLEGGAHLRLQGGAGWLHHLWR